MLARLGDALANVGRSVEAAHAYQKAAVDADQLELIELQRRAAYQFLVSGHIDEGLSAFGAILDPMGLSPAAHAATGTVAPAAQPGPPRACAAWGSASARRPRCRGKSSN